MATATKKKTNKQPSPAQLRARRKFAKMAKARAKAAKAAKRAAGIKSKPKTRKAAAPKRNSTTTQEMWKGWLENIKKSPTNKSWIRTAVSSGLQARKTPAQIKIALHRAGVPKREAIEIVNRAVQQRIARKDYPYHKANPKRRNIAGFMRDGIFHPIRSGLTPSGRPAKKPYSPKKVGEKSAYSTKGAAKRKRGHKAALKGQRSLTAGTSLRQRAISNPKRRRNGIASAKRQYKEFTGRPSRKVTTNYAPKGSKAPKSVAAMGKLKKVFIKGRTPLNFSATNAVLARSGNRMFVLGKGYRLNVRGKKRNPDGFEDLGEITRLEYEIQKDHLGDTAPVTYFHKMGEEGGEKPHAVVNDEGLLLIEGGDYVITERGIEN